MFFGTWLSFLYLKKVKRFAFSLVDWEYWVINIYEKEKSSVSLPTVTRRKGDWSWVSDDVRNISDAVNQFKTARKNAPGTYRLSYILTKTKKNANQAEVSSILSLMNFLQSTVHAVKLHSLFCITLPFLHIEILSFSFKTGLNQCFPAKQSDCNY